MKTKAILFSTDMVKAIMDGTKTQTRRVLKPTRTETTTLLIDMYAGVNVEHCKNELIRTHNVSVGDVFWVRETWYRDEGRKCFYYKTGETIYDSGEVIKDFFNVDSVKWKPSIFMPKNACRHFLKLKDIRIEKVQEISEEDIIAEGINNSEADYIPLMFSWQSLWEFVNSPESWDENPFVWVYEFEKVDKPPMFDMDKQIKRNVK